MGGKEAAYACKLENLETSVSQRDWYWNAISQIKFRGPELPVSYPFILYILDVATNPIIPISWNLLICLAWFIIWRHTQETWNHLPVELCLATSGSPRFVFSLIVHHTSGSFPSQLPLPATALHVSSRDDSLPCSISSFMNLGPSLW